MKKMMGEFKFLVPAVLAISAILGGCKPNSEERRVSYVRLCTMVQNCENFGSNRGDLRFLATATDRFKSSMSYKDLGIKTLVWDYNIALLPVPGMMECKKIDLDITNEYFTYEDEERRLFPSQFKLEEVSYVPKDPENKNIYVDSSNKRVTNFNPKTLEILKKENPLIFTPAGQLEGTNSFAHPLHLQPTLRKVDFNEGYGEVIFDCRNPQGAGDINSQLSKFLIKETIKNKLRSFSDSATASKEVSETRSEKEQEIKDNKKESSIAL